MIACAAYGAPAGAVSTPRAAGGGGQCVVQVERLSGRNPFRLRRLQPNSGGTRRRSRAKWLFRNTLRSLVRNGTILIGCVELPV